MEDLKRAAAEFSLCSEFEKHYLIICLKKILKFYYHLQNLTPRINSSYGKRKIYRIQSPLEFDLLRVEQREILQRMDGEKHST